MNVLEWQISMDLMVRVDKRMWITKVMIKNIKNMRHVNYECEVVHIWRHPIWVVNIKPASSPRPPPRPIGTLRFLFWTPSSLRPWHHLWTTQNLTLVLLCFVKLTQICNTRPWVDIVWRKNDFKHKGSFENKYVLLLREY